MNFPNYEHFLQESINHNRLTLPLSKLLSEDSSFFNSREREYLSSHTLYTFFQIDESLLQESLKDKLKSVLKDKKDAIVKIGDKAIEIKDSVIKKFVEFADNAKKVMEAVKNGAKEVMSLFDPKKLSKVISFDKGKIKKAVEIQFDGSGNGKKEKAKVEVSNGRETIQFLMKKIGGEMKSFFGNKEVKDKIEGSVAESFEARFFGILKEDIVYGNYNQINEDFNLILEGGSKVSSLVHGLAKYPPFSWLHKLESMYERGFSSALNATSKFVAETLKGPGAFNFPIISKILGTIAEVKTKDAIKYSILKPITYFVFPPAGIAITFLSNIALFIAVFEVLESIGIVS